MSPHPRPEKHASGSSPHSTVPPVAIIKKRGRAEKRREEDKRNKSPAVFFLARSHKSHRLLSSRRRAGSAAAMTRRCSHCSNNGHNSRTCPSRGGLKLFGVRLTDGTSMKKSASMGNLSSAHHHSFSSSPNAGGSPSDPLRDPTHVADGYASDDPAHASCSTSCRGERKKASAVDLWLRFLYVTGHARYGGDTIEAQISASLLLQNVKILMVPVHAIPSVLLIQVDDKVVQFDSFIRLEFTLPMNGFRHPLDRGGASDVLSWSPKAGTPTQVASHAQKYFIRQSNTSRRKRRSSLFDMVPDAPVDQLPVLEEQFPTASSQASEAESTNQPPPLNLSLNLDCKPMESTSDDGPLETEEPNVCSNLPPMMVPTFFPAYIPFPPFPVWPPNLMPAGEEKAETHKVLKPIPILPKDPVNGDELAGMSKLSIGEGAAGPMEPSALSVKLLGASTSRPSAFHANPAAGVPEMSQSNGNVIHAV
ncbi:hypothetical protein ACLOJK_040126 [Asimina triloba]